jgi:bifunctional non-homologous end joining protein LigD
MILRSGRLPTSGDYAFEPKWDGFRALVSRNGRLRVKSRRGWDMTGLVPELAGLPEGLAVDGELVAFGSDGLPSFPRLCDRMLHGKRRIEVMLVVFYVLAIDGRPVHRRPYWERRQLLESLELDGDAWSTTPSHTDGEALWDKVCELGLEGVVAKRRSGHYLPGRRGGSRPRTATIGDTRWRLKRRGGCSPVSSSTISDPAVAHDERGHGRRVGRG